MGADHWAAGEDSLTQTWKKLHPTSLLIGFQSYFGALLRFM